MKAHDHGLRWGWEIAFIVCVDLDLTVRAHLFFHMTLRALRGQCDEHDGRQEEERTEQPRKWSCMGVLFFESSMYSEPKGTAEKKEGGGCLVLSP